MNVEDLKTKTLEGIEQCNTKMTELRKAFREATKKEERTFFKNKLWYWEGYKDCLKALDLHFKMEDIKDRANEDIKE